MSHAAFRRVVVLGEFRPLGGVESVFPFDAKEFPVCKRAETEIGGGGRGDYGEENASLADGRTRAIAEAHNCGGALHGFVGDPAGAPWIV